MTQERIHSDFRETEREREGYTNLSSSILSCSSIGHGPGRVLNALEMETIRQAYVDALGDLNVFKARDIEAAISEGLEASAILDALEQTAMAARPSHYYLRAILRRYAAEGIHTSAEAEAARAQFRARRAAAHQAAGAAWYKNPALDYTQRSYAGESYDAGCYVDLDNYGRAGA